MENISLPPREHKKVNYAEFETFSDSSSENNKKQNHGNYISWTSSEDALLVEQVKKYLENKNIQNQNAPCEKGDENLDMNNQIEDFPNNENNEKNNINLNKEKNLAEKTDEKNEKEIKDISSINWNKISEKFENKNARQCQTRWQNILDPNRVKGPWTKEEDLKLIELVKKFGPEKWSNISTYLPGRLGKQCRERWYNHLNPEVRKTGWSNEEEWALFLLHRKYGNSWSTFSEKIPGRTDNTIKNHWNSIMKKNIVSINNQYQEMIKGKTKEEIEEIDKNIMDKCNQVMNKDYNEYYQEKLKEFPMLKTSKFGKKVKDKINNENYGNNDTVINNIENMNDNDNENKKTPDKVKKKIFENIKVSRDLNKTNKNKSKNENINKCDNEDYSKEKKLKINKKHNNSKKNHKYRDVNDDKELKLLKSGEKILQKDKNMLIKEAENKFKEKQKLRKEEKKPKIKNNHLKLDENEESNKSIDNIPTFTQKKSSKKIKNKGRPKKLSAKKNKINFNVSKLSSHNKEKESPSIKNININQKISFQNTIINTNFNNTQMNPNPIFGNNDFIKTNNINMPYPIYPNEKYYYADEDKDFTKMNFNKILLTDSKDINKAKKESQFPFKVPPTQPFYRSDIKNSSESSGGNNSLGKITPDYRMNPPFMPSNDKYYIMPQPGPLFYNSNPNQIRYIRQNNNNNNKISTDSNSIHSYSMNQSMISANSAFKKSSSGSGSGSRNSFQPRAGGFNFNINTADLNKEYFSNINLDEKKF